MMKSPAHADAYLPPCSIWHAPHKGGSSAPQTTTTNTTSQPWSEQQPYLKEVFQGAQQRYQSDNPQYFPGATIAGFNPAQQQAQQMGIDRATQGNPLLPAAQGQAMQTIQGDYLNAGNPYTAGLVNSVNAAIRPGIDSRFSNAGRYGSSAHAGATTSAMTNAIAPLLFNQYGQERQNQLGQANAAPALAQADYNDPNALASIGQMQQGQQQNVLNSDIERFNFDQNLEANKLAQYLGLVQGGYGGTGMNTMTGPNPQTGKGGGAAQGLGLGMQAIGTGAQAYNAFSDRRLKRDIKRVGTTECGLPIYTFRYVGSEATVMGVMADEVEKMIPEAVGELYGFATVDYAQVR